MNQLVKLFAWGTRIMKSGLGLINKWLPDPPKCNVPMTIPVIQAIPVPETDQYQLLKAVTFIVGSFTCTIPKGFQWDGASIPWWAWQIVGTPFFPDFMAASLLHDYMYENTLGKDDADLYFYWILRQQGVSQKKAEKMHYAVVVGGKKAYKNYQKAVG